MSELVLSFTPPPGAELVATRFSHPSVRQEVRARLGSDGRSFKWTAGVQSLAVLLLRTAAWARNGRAEHPEPPCLEGRRPSMAASVNDLLTNPSQWVADVFGGAGGGSAIEALIGRSNRDFKACPKAP
ncbi:MAG TPA: hypothetical protein VKE74_30640, partial [Gemmataceae bacterium]|nr:hypothetical protein [Gemmataceae bacterium]